METIILTPLKALNKAFLRTKPNRAEIDNFKANLLKLIESINYNESEEFNKNLLSDFFKNTFYKQDYFINTKGRNDLVIHHDKNALSNVGVIIETKNISNKSEMMSKENLNTKAFQELILYYLRERITHKNLEVKHLIVSNIYEWFIFDANVFDRLFAQNKELVRKFQDFEIKRLAEIKTDFFYKQIAEPFINSIEQPIEYTYFNLEDYSTIIKDKNNENDTKLIPLYKLLSPEHLLKLPFANDSNRLDKGFYNELLHIMGLTEIKEGGKKLIKRNEKKERNAGSILEDAILQLDSLGKIARLENPNHYGNTHEERLFNVALELSITWINRILFLKLLEAQLVSYHKGNKTYQFLQPNKINHYNDLDCLFFQVLARKYQERTPEIQNIFSKIPYLNSSLFEPTELEQVTVFISNLKCDKGMPLYEFTVLKDEHGKRRSGKMNTLTYLFSFLDAYDFGSESNSDEIQQESKTLINASVLGLIFEKINGYKDGSFFTPGFITMYMCHESIRKAVVQRFNEVKNWNCTNIDELKDKIENRKEANEIINSLKICDPAVGSGHFLVSALNEIIAIKSDLNVLLDFKGRRLKDYKVKVLNDELFIFDIDTEEEFYYTTPTPRRDMSGKINKGESLDYISEKQLVQQSIFQEKQLIIENCLFGVDINPNSVKICRLRLWIELLKNAYYTIESNYTELETLPNIDINIKCGNSLVSRFALDADLGQALKKSNWTIESYRMAVATYRNPENRVQKQEMERLIANIKADFRSEIAKNDPKIKKLSKLKGDLFNLTNQTKLFDIGKKEKVEWEKQVGKLSNEIQKLESEIEEIKANKIYENAFEWRFEFPEVLNEAGDFVGFDVVIGNPPYFIMTKNSIDNKLLYHYVNEYNVIKNATSKNIFNLFIELGIRIGDFNSLQSMIVPEGLFETRSYIETTTLLEKLGSVINITRIEGMIFDNANTGNVVFIFEKNSNNDIITKNKFTSNEELIEHKDIKNSVILKIENSNFKKLSEICYLFKGMVVSDRKNFISETPSKEMKDKFLLGNCISKWKIEKFFHTNYDSLKIVGGTKVREKHNVVPRILIRRTGDYLCCAYLEEVALTESTLYSCWSINNEVDNLFIISILHSKLMDYYLKSNLITNPQAFPQILMTDLENLPIPLPNKAIQNELINLVRIILYQNNANKDINFVQKQIDQLVYQLYGLTEEEIKIIESSVK
jgi:hypothetical protein